MGPAAVRSEIKELIIMSDTHPDSCDPAHPTAVLTPEILDIFEALLRQPGDEAVLKTLQKGLRKSGPDWAVCYQQFHPKCHAALTAVLQHNGHFFRELCPLGAAQVCLRHGLYGEPVPVTAERLTALASDSLCLLLLTEIINKNRPLERFLTRARSFLLGCHPEERTLLSSLRPLLIALAQQGFNNEFVWPVTEVEEQAVSGLGEGLSRALQAEDAALIEPLLLRYALYRPLASHPAAAVIAARAQSDFACDLQPLLGRILHEPLRELELRETVPALEEVVNPVSRAVRAQYEESPYPRWLKFTRTPKSLADRITEWRPGFVWPREQPDQRLQVLVAGCGTGQHSLQVALGSPDADVLALDLSRASLAYALRMTERYHARNLTFLQGDLLALPRLGRKFHHIECAGVLHHIKDHAAAWAVLVDCLLPGGTMSIGVYSKAARLLVSHLRSRIQREGLSATPAEVRHFRTRLFEEPAWAALVPLLERAGDIFSLSMTRDLLFHVQEHQYTVAEIERISGALGLELIGVRFPRALRERVQSGKPPIHLPVHTFAQWRACEQAYVGSLTMFHFWLHKPALTSSSTTDNPPGA